jgi:hypothetical protein
VIRFALLLASFALTAGIALYFWVALFSYDVRPTSRQMQDEYLARGCQSIQYTPPLNRCPPWVKR